ncbi:CLUMA_CG012845, isoform A [Clunio marinus]|uniref:CLUMA_CG012845, isoform A n=1 Tax=Clunio marinus TaxID=568069 RepID=A0A1J1IKC1_9DIPT|nr:CLUMA_CG012845, isoform A [Clunio marinus]
MLHVKSNIFTTLVSVDWHIDNLCDVLLLSQAMFGIFPICGLRHLNSAQLSFKYRSFSFIYSMLIQCGIVLMFTTSIYKQLNSRIEYSKAGKRRIWFCF